MQVVDMNGFVGGCEAEFVGGAVDVAAFDASACEPHGEAVVIMVAAIIVTGVGAGRGEFDRGRTAKFAAPDDQRVIEHAALFQVDQQCGYRLVALPGESSVIHSNVVVAVPWLACAGPDLHESYAAFEQVDGR